MNTTHTKHKTVKYKYTVNKTRAGIQITHGIHTTNLGFVWQFIYLLLLRAYTNKTYKAYITYTNVKNYNPKSEYKQNTIKFTNINKHNIQNIHIYIYTVCTYIYIQTKSSTNSTIQYIYIHKQIMHTNMCKIYTKTNKHTKNIRIYTNKNKQKPPGSQNIYRYKQYAKMYIYKYKYI